MASSARVVIQDSKVDVVLSDPSVVVELGDSGPQGPPGARGSQVLSGDVDPTSVVGLVGDQYINTTTGKIFGPKSASGWGDGVFLIDPENLGQIHIQSSPAATWNITHNLNFVPNITVVDSEGKVVEGAYEYISASAINATFSESISGSAYLS